MALTPFATIFARAAERKGGAAAIEAMLPAMKSVDELRATSDDRWLACMARVVFQAGFSWTVIEQKWPGFETAFQGFEPHACAFMSDEQIDALLKNPDIVRNAAKIRSVRENAVFVTELASKHGSAARFFADWPVTDQVGLLDLLKARGSRLGGNSGPMLLRFMGKDSFVISADVAKALVKWGAVDKAPSSKKDMAAVQAAFNAWTAESGRPSAHVSRTLALSVGEDD